MWELLTGDEPYADLHYGTIIGKFLLDIYVMKFTDKLTIIEYLFVYIDHGRAVIRYLVT